MTGMLVKLRANKILEILFLFLNHSNNFQKQNYPITHTRTHTHISLNYVKTEHIFLGCSYNQPRGKSAKNGMEKI